MAGCYIQCKSQLQSTIALSTSEAEYCALNQAMRTLIPIREIILEFIEHVRLVDVKERYIFKSSKHVKNFTTTIYEDNSTALNLATNQKITSRTKHWCIKWHFFWEHLNDESKNMLDISIRDLLKSLLVFNQAIDDNLIIKVHNIHQAIII